MSTMHLASNDLCVAVPQFEFSFPKDITELIHFFDVFEGITTAIVSTFGDKNKHFNP